MPTSYTEKVSTLSEANPQERQKKNPGIQMFFALPFNFYVIFIPCFGGRIDLYFFSPDNIFPLFYMCIIALSPHYLLEQGKKY